jgi:hypothetical protein
MLFLSLLLGLCACDDTIQLQLKAASYKAAYENAGDMVGYNENEEKAFFYTNGSVEFKCQFPADAEYTLTLEASCQAAEKELAKIDIEVNGKSVIKNFTLTSEDPKDYSFTIKGKAGEGTIKVIFTNDKYKEGEYDLNLYLHKASLKKK